MKEPTPLSDDRRKPSTAMHIGLWVAQIMLAAVFGMIGFAKTTTPMPALIEQLVWPGEYPAALVRFIGAAELLGAAGLILPAATRIKPMLTPLAATGLALVMVLAALFHLIRGEFPAIPLNVFLLALALFVAWGRTKRAVIESR